MKKSRFTEEQIVFALKQAELGMSVPEVCLKLGCARRYAGDAQIISPQRCHRAALLAERPGSADSIRQ